MKHQYKIGELAGAVGVTVRTLHHYDQVGLLKPSGQTEGGHRLYTRADLVRLQQVMTLRYLGFPLDRIRELLARPGMDLASSLRMQVDVVRERIAELRQIEAALDALLAKRGPDGEWPSQLLEEAAAMISAREHEREDKMSRYFTDEHMQQFDELGRELGPKAIREFEEAWQAVYADAQAALDVDPTSDEARELLRRWEGMMERTQEAYASKPDLWGAIGNAWNDGAFDDHPKVPGKEVFEFIERVRAANG